MGWIVDPPWLSSTKSHSTKKKKVTVQPYLLCGFESWVYLKGGRNPNPDFHAMTIRATTT